MAAFRRSAPVPTASGFYTMDDTVPIGPRRTASNKVLVAVDFGTTHSAVAWTIYSERSKAKPDIQIIQRWPTKGNTFDKVPTLLHYDYVTPIPAWGFPVCGKDRRYEWFKLEQDPNYTRDMLRRNYPSTTIQPQDLNHVERLITDFLKHIKSHAEKEIREHYSLQPPSFLDIPWEYIITVPAMWPESAQNMTLRSAKNAGMARDASIKIVAEPEAAGIYGLSTSRTDTVKEGDTFMICDAGGGTVDLISYTITQPGSNGSNARVEEASPGTGGLCGSSFLDRRFNTWLTQHFKNCPEWKDHQTSILEEWEREFKRDFKADGKPYLFKVPGMKDNPALGVRKGKLTVTGSTVEWIFRPIVDKILGLVQGQLNTVMRNGFTLKAIFMAGGFGNNDYLKNTIAREVGRDIKVVKMKDCETAIVRGALMQGLSDQKANPHQSWPTVETKRAKVHYGISALEPYNPRKHGPHMVLVPGGVDGGRRVQIIKWFIEKNKKYKDKEPQYVEFFLDEREDDVQHNNNHLSDATFDFYICPLEQPPMQPDATHDQPTCTRIARLPTKLHLIPIDELDTDVDDDGYLWYYIPFKISFIRNMEYLRFELIFTPSGGEPRKVAHVDAEWISA